MRAKICKILLLLVIVVFLFSFISCKDTSAQTEIKELKAEIEKLKEESQEPQDQDEQKPESTEETKEESSKAETPTEEAVKELSPTIVGSLYISGRTAKVIVIENHAYVGGQGLKIIDITDKTNPTTISDVSVSGWLSDFQIEENYAYLAYGGWDNEQGLKIIDITDKNNPVLVETFESDSIIETLSVIDNYVYAVFTVWEEKEENYLELIESGIKIIDVTDKANIVEVKKIDKGQSGINSIYLEGDYAYTFEGGSFVILDITDRENPQNIGNLMIPSGGWIRNFFIEGDYVYLPSGNSIQVIDITDKANPTIIGGVFTKGEISDISVHGDYAFIAYVIRDENYNPKESGMQVIDITDKTTPKVVTDIKIEGEAMGIFAEEEYVYIGAGQAGLKIVKLFN